jgi:multicomponent K+:H+ antiporter subunit D
MNHWVIAPVLWPWLAGILLLLGHGSLAWQRGVSVVAVAGQLGLALALAAEVSDGRMLVYTLGNWPAPFGIVLVADRLAAWMLVTTAFLAFFALWYALRGDDAAGSHFHTLFQCEPR